MKRFLITVIMIITCFLLQSTIFQQLELADVTPNILLILTVATGYMRGCKEGMYVGFFCGLILDCVYGEVIGAYSLLYMNIGFLNGFANKIYYNDDFTVPVLLVGVSDLLYNLFIYVFQFLLRSRLDIGYYFFRRMLPEIIYTVLISVVLYKLLHTLNGWLENIENGEA